jgi:hypothetical protein
LPSSSPRHIEAGEEEVCSPAFVSLPLTKTKKLIRPTPIAYHQGERGAEEEKF